MLRCWGTQLGAQTVNIYAFDNNKKSQPLLSTKKNKNKTNHTNKQNKTQPKKTTKQQKPFIIKFSIPGSMHNGVTGGSEVLAMFWEK